MNKEYIEKLIKESQNSFDYDTKDMTVKRLVDKLTYDVYVYKDETYMKDIEKFLLGIPMMVYTVKIRNEYKIISDPCQILSLYNFLDNKFALEGLDILTYCNGYHFLDFPVAFQRKLQSRTIRVVEFYNVKDNKIIDFLKESKNGRNL